MRAIDQGLCTAEACRNRADVDAGSDGQHKRVDITAQRVAIIRGSLSVRTCPKRPRAPPEASALSPLFLSNSLIDTSGGSGPPVPSSHTPRQHAPSARSVSSPRRTRIRGSLRSYDCTAPRGQRVDRS
eukprot:1194922-Prorocentrum_minimum.AAC.3